IDASIRCYRQRAEPVPLVWIHWIVVNPMRRTEGCASVGAAGEHHVTPVGGVKLLNGSDHVDIAVGRSVGAVHCQEDLPRQSARIDLCSEQQAATKINRSDLVKSRRHIRVLCVARANAPKPAARVAASDKKVTVTGYIQRPPLRSVRNTERRLPCGSAICRSAEAAELTSGKFGPKVILKAVPHTGGSPIDGEPLLVAAVRSSVRRLLHPRLSAVCGAPNIAAKCIYQQAKVEKLPCLIGIGHGVNAENVVL